MLTALEALEFRDWFDDSIVAVQTTERPAGENAVGLAGCIGVSQSWSTTRILHLTAGNHRRGAEAFAVELAEHCRSRGFEVRVMAVTDSGVSDPLAVEVAAGSRTDPRGLARIVSAARWSDAVVSFGSSSPPIGALAARLARRPCVYRQIGDPSVWGQVTWSNLRIGVPARSAQRVVALYPAAGGGSLAPEVARRAAVDGNRIRLLGTIGGVPSVVLDGTTGVLVVERRPAPSLPGSAARSITMPSTARPRGRTAESISRWRTPGGPGNR